MDEPNLTWPKTVNKNIGLDFSLFKDRVSGSADLFYDDFTRILTTDNTDPLSFIGTHYINAGEQIRKGYELNLNTINFKTASGFQWNTLINISHVKYYWKQRFPNQDVPSYASIDDPVNSIYTFKTNGILQIGESAPAFQPAVASLPGSPILVDVNGDKKLDSADVIRYGIDPKITIGFGNTFSYKNFDASIFFMVSLADITTIISVCGAIPAALSQVIKVASSKQKMSGQPQILRALCPALRLANHP